jgi:hypothetical protein
VYIPWIKTKSPDIPAAVTESHAGLEQLLKDVEQSEAEYKALVKAKAAPEELYDWRATLITRLGAMSEALKAHMDEEERFFPKVVSLHFTEKDQQATLEVRCVMYVYPCMIGASSLPTDPIPPSQHRAEDGLDGLGAH